MEVIDYPGLNKPLAVAMFLEAAADAEGSAETLAALDKAVVHLFPPLEGVPLPSEELAPIAPACWSSVDLDYYEIYKALEK